MRGFIVVALLCIVFAIIYQSAGCQPDTTGCTYDSVAQKYICPDER